MKRSASTRRTAGESSLVGLAKVMARLTPRQLNDELGLATAEMKKKGIKAGIAAAFMVVALLFIAGLAIALVVAAILGLGTVMPGWLAALLVAALFLIIAAVGALVGYSRFKKTLPLLPEEALYGLRYDLGVLKEGRSFDPATLEKKPKEPKDKDKKKKDQEEDGPKKASEEELRTRTRQRREHMAAVRDGLGEKTDVKAQIKELKARRAAQRRSAAGSGTGGAGTSSSEDVLALLKERWQPLTVLAASLLALVIMLRRLSQK